MSHIEQIKRQELADLKSQIEYSTDTLMNRIDEMEDWEVKEFIAINLDYRTELYALENHIKNVF